jgi:hypothetical protein
MFSGEKNGRKVGKKIIRRPDAVTVDSWIFHSIKLYKYDIVGSIAHADAVDQKLITTIKQLRQTD